MRVLPVLFLLPLMISAQIDTARTIPLVGVHITGQLPYADLANRFGSGLAAGGAFLVKNKHNFVYGASFNYMFGGNVKEDVLSQMRNESGFVTDNEGYPADLRISMRGMSAYLCAGKVLSFMSANNNSGLLLMAGIGGMEHRIRLYDAQQKIAAIRGTLSHGYDRLSLGFSVNAFVGYLFLSEYRFVNFYAGFDFSHAFTRSVRKYNYDTGRPDTGRRQDGLAGFRFGWILPLYKKKPDEFYYY